MAEAKQRPLYRRLLPSGRGLYYAKLGLSELEKCADRASEKFPNEPRKAFRQNTKEMVRTSLRGITAQSLPLVFKQVPVKDDDGNEKKGADGQVLLQDGPDVDEEKTLLGAGPFPGPGWHTLDELAMTSNPALTLEALFDDDPADWSDIVDEVLAVTYEKKRPVGSGASRLRVS